MCLLCVGELDIDQVGDSDHWLIAGSVVRIYLGDGCTRFLHNACGDLDPAAARQGIGFWYTLATDPDTTCNRDSGLILSVPKCTANLYCICLSIDLRYT